MIFTAYHRFVLVIFAVVVAFAVVTVFKLRNTSATYNARLLPFAYYSLSAWILSGVQYVLLSSSSSDSFPIGFFRNTGLLLGVVQIALWASAVLSLHSKPFSRISLTLPYLIAFTSITASVGYTTTLLTYKTFAEVEAASAGVIFAAVAYSIWQLGLSKVIAGAFVIHGLSQSIWRYLWSTPLAKSDIGVLGFPIFCILLLILWIRLISAILHRAESLHKEAVKDIERLELPDLLATCDVMISSTVKDLGQEREATERAISGLHLTGFRAEAFGSLPHPPRKICALLAEHCDIFILIIGEQYGHEIESEGISVVQFEYQVAYNQNPQKILVYVKDGVKREHRLEEFREYLEDFDRGYFRSRFTTPEDLYQRIHKDLARWLVLRVNQMKRQLAVADLSDHVQP